MRECSNPFAWEFQSCLFRSAKVRLAGSSQGSGSSAGAPPSPRATEVPSSFLAGSLRTIKNNCIVSHQQRKTSNRWVSTRASCILIQKLQLSLINKKLLFSAVESSGLLPTHQWCVITSAAHAGEECWSQCFYRLTELLRKGRADIHQKRRVSSLCPLSVLVSEVTPQRLLLSDMALIASLTGPSF